MSNWLEPRSGKPLIIAHRGASHEMPENTMGAFRLAVEQGADALEFDVQFSADSIPVIIHDPTLGRATDGRGRVSNQTFSQLQQIDAGHGEKIPSLEMLFAELKTSVLYNIEIKYYSLRDVGIEKSIAHLIQRFQLEKQVLVSSFFPANLRRIQQHLGSSAVITGLVRYKGFGFIRHFYQGEADHPWYQLVDAAYMRWAAENNQRVHVWTVDDLDKAQRLAKLGVHGIITNRPAYLQTNL